MKERELAKLSYMMRSKERVFAMPPQLPTSTWYTEKAKGFPSLFPSSPSHYTTQLTEASVLGAWERALLGKTSVQQRQELVAHLCWQQKDNTSPCRNQIFTAGMNVQIYSQPKTAKIMQENHPHFTTCVR